jgi:hypothetical protein
VGKLKFKLSVFFDSLEIYILTVGILAVNIVAVNIVAVDILEVDIEAWQTKRQLIYSFET